MVHVRRRLIAAPLIRWSFIVSMVSCFFSASFLAAGEFEPNARYVILINGETAPNVFLEGKQVHRLTQEELEEFCQKNLSGMAQFQEFMNKLSAIPERSRFRIVFNANSDGDVESNDILISEPTPMLAVTTPVEAKTETSTSLQTGATNQQNEDVKEDDDVIIDPNSVVQYVVINREATREEKVSFPNLIPATFAQLVEYRERHPQRAETLKMMIAEARKRELTETPFTLSWRQNPDGMIVSFIELKWENARATFAPHGYKDLPREKKLPTHLGTPSEQPLTPELRADLNVDSITRESNGENKEQALIRTLLWILTANDRETECAVAENNQLRFSDERVDKLLSNFSITTPEDLLAVTSTQTMKAVTNELTHSERISLNTLRKKRVSCLNGYFESAWKLLVAENGSKLAADFKYMLETVHSEGAAIEFQSGSHTLAIHSTALQNKITFLEDVLIDLPHQTYAQTLSTSFLNWATTDTTSDSQDSKKEPIDILASAITIRFFPTLETDSELGQIGRGFLTRHALQHILNPIRFPEKIMLSKSSDEENAAAESYFIFCAGESFRGLKEDFVVSGNSLIKIARVSLDVISRLREEKGSIAFYCGNSGAKLSSPVEPLRVKLKNPIDYKFSHGSDRKITAVLTFPMVSNVGRDFVAMVKAGTALQGYRVGTEAPIRDIKASFVQDLVNADLFIPADHGDGGNKLLVGHQGNGSEGLTSRLILTKAFGENSVELIVYVPSYDKVEKNSVYMQDTEMANLFRQRRQLEVPRRLTVMNVACGSKWTVDVWMRAYKNSLDGEEFSEAQLRSLESDVPIVIGASRSFDTGSTDHIASHSAIPLRALEVAGSEHPISELLEFLRNSSFGPVCNTDTENHFDVATQQNAIVVVVDTEAGERLVQ